MQPDNYIYIKGKKYTIQGKIGQGAVGQVFLGRNQEGEKFAIKKIRNYKKKQIQESVDAQIELQQKFNANQYVVQCFGKEVIDGNAYVVFELGQFSLRNRIDMHPMTKKQYLIMLKDLFEGLLQVHLKDIIHRDIKPQNIIYRDGVYKITDFGISVQNTSSNQIVGTPLYWAPQIIFQQKEQFDQKVDVWSLGVVAFQSYFGIHPFFYDSNLLTKRSLQNLKQNISYLTKQEFKIEKVVEYLREQKKLYDKAKFIQMRVKSTLPQMILLIQSFFKYNPQDRDQMDFFYSILQSMPNQSTIKTCKSQNIQDLPFDIQLFVKTLNLFYQLDYQIPYMFSEDVEKTIQSGLWFICRANYPGLQCIQYKTLKPQQANRIDTQYWKIIQQTLFQYYLYLKQSFNNLFEKLGQLKFYILLCSNWKKIFLGHSKICQAISKITGQKFQSLLQVIEYVNIYTEKQFSLIEQFIMQELLKN